MEMLRRSWSAINLEIATTLANRDNEIDKKLLHFSLRSTKTSSLLRTGRKKAFNSRKKNVKTFHFKVGDEVLKANKRKEGRKGGKLESNWSGPFYISSISEKGVATLTTMKGPQLKQSVNVSQLKPFIKSNFRGNIINIESQFK